MSKSKGIKVLEIEDMTIIKTSESWNLHVKGKTQSVLYFAKLEHAIGEIFDLLIASKIKRKKRYGAAIGEFREIIQSVRNDLKELLSSQNIVESLQKEKRYKDINSPYHSSKIDCFEDKEKT